MKKITIYYFSGTGNTWWVADRLQQQLKSNGHPVECYSIEALSKESIEKQIDTADHIVFGFPVYGSTAPGLMYDFIRHFPNASNKKPVSIFATHAMASGDSAYYIGLFLTRKGYELIQTRHFTMMNNFHIPKFRFYRPRNDWKLDRLLEKTLPKVKAFAADISSNKARIIGNTLLGHLLGRTQRKHIDKVIGLVSKSFTVDTARCVNCEKCMRICPTRNIVKCQHTYAYANHCILCLRCYSQCPTSAILIGKGSEDERKYPRYKGPGRPFNIDVLIKNQ